jgi:hypothetical protein
MGTIEKGSESVLEYFYHTVTARSEDDVTYLLQVLNPVDDKAVMGKAYTKVIGYNPISYFDKNALRAKLFEVCSRLSDDARGRILSNANNIVDTAYGARTVIADKLWPLFIIKGAVSNISNQEDLDEFIDSFSAVKGEIDRVDVDVIEALQTMKGFSALNLLNRATTAIKKLESSFSNDDDDDDDNDDEQLDEEEQLDDNDVDEEDADTDNEDDEEY